MTGFRLLKHPAARRAILALAAAEALIVALALGYERASLWAARNRLSYQREPIARELWRYETRGIVRPTILKAGEAGARDDEEVIGVEVAGKARAYRLDAFRDREAHIVNDLFEGVPVSVAYCDITDCVRAYAGPRGAAPLDLGLAGLIDREMVVKAGGVLYFHKSGEPVNPGEGRAPLPYKPLVPTRTTWKEWSRRHPETGLYTGTRAILRK